MNLVFPKFKEALDYIVEEIPEFQEGDNTPFVERGDGSIEIWFPDVEDWEMMLLTKESFIQQANEFHSYTMGDFKNRIKTDKGIYYPIEPMNAKGYMYFAQQVHIESQLENVTVKIDYDHAFLVGLITLATGAYSGFRSPLELTDVLSIKYPKVKGNHEEDLELEMSAIQSFRFEIMSNHNVLFGVMNIPVGLKKEFTGDYEEDFPPDDEEITDTKSLVLKPLMKFDDGMRMFLVAASIEDWEFKYLSLYKILEHYSPIALKADVYEDLTKKLDSPKALHPDRKFLDSILDISAAYQFRAKDLQLIKVLLTKSIDITDLTGSFSPFVVAQMDNIDLNYKTPKRDRDRCISTLAEILYSTRNKLAHAKANFQNTGYECPVEELEGMNALVEEIANRVIRWHNRLPKHLK